MSGINNNSWVSCATADTKVTVKVNVNILGLGVISESRMEFSLHCYFRQTWKDPRLKFELLESLSNNSPLSHDSSLEVNGAQVNG